MSSITDSIYRYCELFRGAGVSVAGFYESFRTFLVPLEYHSRITDPGHNVLRLGGPEKADGGARSCQMLLWFRQDNSEVIQCSNHIPQSSLVVVLPCDCELTPTRPWRVGVNLRFPAHDYRGAALPPLPDLLTRLSARCFPQVVSSSLVCPCPLFFSSLSLPFPLSPPPSPLSPLSLPSPLFLLPPSPSHGLGDCDLRYCCPDVCA